MNDPQNSHELLLRAHQSPITRPCYRNAQTAAGISTIAFMRNLGNSILLSTAAVILSLLSACRRLRLRALIAFASAEDMAFTLLSSALRPPLLVLLPLSLYFKRFGLTNLFRAVWVNS